VAKKLCGSWHDKTTYCEDVADKIKFTWDGYGTRKDGCPCTMTKIVAIHNLLAMPPTKADAKELVEATKDASKGIRYEWSEGVDQCYGKGGKLKQWDTLHKEVMAALK